MKDQYKTKTQLIEELETLRKQIVKLKKVETKRKQAEDALKFTRFSVDNAVDTMVCVDRDARFIDVNDAFCRSSGYTRKELLSMTVHDIDPDYSAEIWPEFWKKLKQNGSLTFETCHRSKDGRICPVEITANFLEYKGKEYHCGFARDITERKQAERERERLFQQVKSSREELESLSHRLLEVQEAERRDLVRKLHDEVGQDLTALSLNLNIIQSVVRSQLPAEMITKLTTRMDDSLNLVEKTIERIRDVMAELRPPVLDDYGLTAALHWYGKQFSERTGIVPVIELEELMPRLPLPVETALFRIAQEALTNVAKYAQAKNVTVTLQGVDDSARLIIADDGLGFDLTAHPNPDARLQWGLINMKERAQAGGGNLSVETGPGKGTSVIVEVPR